MGGPAKRGLSVKERSFIFTRPVKDTFQKVLFLNSWHVIKQWYSDFFGGVLTVDGKGDLSFPDSDPRDDGFAYVLAGIGLVDGRQMQLVAVTQNLLGN